MHIVLVEPEIPQNTGNIARTCAVTGSILHLIRPLGFSTDDRHLKRAGLDYWNKVEIHYYDSFQEMREQYRDHTYYFLTTKGDKSYADVKYGPKDILVFGKETAGLPMEIINANRENAIRIPMKNDIRSLNLSNACAIVVFEAWRQNGFFGATD